MKKAKRQALEERKLVAKLTRQIGKQRNVAQRPAYIQPTPFLDLLARSPGMPKKDT